MTEKIERKSAAMRHSSKKAHKHFRNQVLWKKNLQWAICLSLALSMFFLSTFSPSTNQRSKLIPLEEKPVFPRIYIYELPGKYNNDWLSNPRCRSHLFAAEVAIHEALMESPVRTLNPKEADLFFIPVYVSCNFSTVNGFPSLGHARSLISSAVDFISSEFPFWKRNNGADHVFAATHDYGACFHAMEDVAVKEGIPEFMKRSIILQTFGVERDHPCQQAEHVQIPPYVPPELLPSPRRKRDIWVYFRGKMEVKPKNVSGRVYGDGLRTRIWKRFGSDRRFFLKRKRFDGFRSEMARSVFCLCPRGWAPWSPRLVESVAVGCVPVLIADGIRLPFPGVVNWAGISLRVAERDVERLDKILLHVSETNLSVIQRNLEKPANREALIFNREIRSGDATWQVLKALSTKIRQRQRSSQI